VILRETAYAKINLALHVRRRRDDGYHELETIFAFCADGDTLTAEASGQNELAISGPFADGLSASDNLIIAAAYAAGHVARFHLVKNLPVASGIGGGSADAAAALRLLAQLHGIPLPSLDVQRRLGADVPACVISHTRRATGVGEVLEPTESVSGIPILLVNPGLALSTRDVFARWDGIDRGPLGDWGTGRNDLERAAVSIVPEIGLLVAWLAARDGVMVARMSGSGATCFGLFGSIAARDEAASAARQDWPNAWTLATVLR